MKLEGKIAIITGAGSGIGRATALRLAREGASIVVADWNETGASETVALVEQAGGKAAAIKIDVTKTADLAKMFAFAEKTYGGFDILYNNAGVTTGQPRFPDCPEENWRRTAQQGLLENPSHAERRDHAEEIHGSHGQARQRKYPNLLVWNKRRNHQRIDWNTRRARH